MKKICFIIPWFGSFREDFYFWLKSVEHNPTIDFLLPTDQELAIYPPPNVKVIKTELSFVEQLAKERVWEGCVISKPYKMCDYKVAYGEMFQDYIMDYDFWGHCDADMVFGDIRHFVTDEVLDRYDRLGVDGFFSLFRNTPAVNAIYRKAGDIQTIFTDQRPFGFDEWGINRSGTAHYWIEHLKDRVWLDKVFDNLAPYHYGFQSGTVRKFNLGIKNVMFSFEKGKLYRCGIKDGKLVKDETLYVHIQKRPVYVKTEVSDCFSIVPPGNYILFVENITPQYLKRNIREGRFWAYYTRARNKINRLLGKEPWQNTVLLPEQDM